MNKSIKVLVIFPLICFFLAGHVDKVFGEEPYSINVIKYQLKDQVHFDENISFDGSKISSPVDSGGNELLPMAGISYQIDQLVLKEPELDKTLLSSYSVIEGTAQIVTTNNHGEATFTGLSEGVYKVTELENKLIAKVMSPVLVTLPLETNQGNLTSVYLYPKSNVVNADGGLNPSRPDKLPQTSGEIGRSTPIIIMFIMTLSLGVISLSRLKKLNKKGK